MSGPFTLVLSNMSVLDNFDEIGGHCVEVLLCVIDKKLWVVSHIEYIFCSRGHCCARHVLICPFKELLDIFLYSD